MSEETELVDVEFIVKKHIFLTGYGRLQPGDTVWLKLDQGVRLTHAGWLKADDRMEALYEYLKLFTQAKRIGPSRLLDTEKITALRKHIGVGWTIKSASKKLGMILSTAYKLTRKHGFQYKWNEKILSILREEDIVSLKLDRNRLSSGIGKDTGAENPA